MPSKIVRILGWNSAGKVLRCHSVGLIARGRGFEVQQGRGVQRPAPQPIVLRRRELGAEVEVAVAGPMEVFAIGDEGAVVEVGQEQGRAEPGMADDEVRSNLGPGLQRLVDGLVVPHRDVEVERERIRLSATPRANRTAASARREGPDRDGRPAGTVTRSPGRRHVLHTAWAGDCRQTCSRRHGHPPAGGPGARTDQGIPCGRRRYSWSISRSRLGSLSRISIRTSSPSCPNGCA